MAQHSFYVGDYVVFGLTVLVSIGIGIFYALSGGRQRTTSEYLVGGRSMTYLPVAISLLVSFESSIMMLGIPAEGYIYGMQYIMSSAGFLISEIMSVYIMVPLIHPLKITSAYEYLEMRFKSRPVRLLGTVLGMFTYTWYMGIVLFGPAVALEAVTGFPQWSSISVVALVAVIYTSIGGIKAVIWTDVFQAFIMFAGILGILIQGTIEVGGPAEVWRLAGEGGRLNFFNFDPDPRTRHTFWNLFFGSFIRGFGLTFNQSTVQRISSTQTLAQAKRVLLIVAPAFFVSIGISIYEGVVAYTYYQTKGCDPLESKNIRDPNQIIPYMVMDIFKGLPGMPGLFLASLFSASLSTLSSGLSSLSALLWADIVQPIVGDISEFKATIIAKLSVVVFGVSACGVAVLVSLIGGPLTQITGSLLAGFAGPLTGLFFLGCFFPRAQAKGTLIGGILGLAVSMWLSMGITFSKKKKRAPWLPPASTDMCSLDDMLYNETMWSNTTSHPDMYSNTSVFWEGNTTVALTTTEATAEGLEGIEQIYALSYLWLSPLGNIITIIFGLIASYFTGMNKPGEVDPRYLVPLSSIVFFWAPKSFKNKVAALGPQFIKDEYKDKFPDPAKKSFMDVELEIHVDDIASQPDQSDKDVVKHANGEESISIDDVTLTEGVNGEDKKYSVG